MGQTNNQQAFSDAAAANGLIHLGQVVINGIPRFEGLTRGKMKFDNVEVEETSVEDKNATRMVEREELIKQDSASGGFDAHLHGLARKLGVLSAFARKVKGGKEILDNGVMVWTGYIPVSCLTRQLSLWRSAKMEDVSGRKRLFLRLGHNTEVSSQRILGKLRYHLPRLEPDAGYALVRVWVNPDGQGWMRANFVIEDFFSKERYIAANAKDGLETRDLDFQLHLEVAHPDNPEATFPVVTLDMDWLVTQYGNTLEAKEKEIREAATSSQIEELNEAINEKFAART